MYDVPLPLTVGDWMATEPVEMDLKAGRNTLQFTLKSPNKGVTIRDFTLTPME